MHKEEDTNPLTAQPGLQDFRSNEVDTVAGVQNPSSGFWGNIRSLMCWCRKIKVLSKLVWWYKFNIIFKITWNVSPLLLFFPLVFSFCSGTNISCCFFVFILNFTVLILFFLLFFPLVVDVIELPALLQPIKISFVFLSFTGLLAWFPLSLEIMVSSNTFHVGLTFSFFILHQGDKEN